MVDLADHPDDPDDDWDNSNDGDHADPTDHDDNADHADHADHDNHSLGPKLRIMRAVIGYVFLMLSTLKNKAGSLVAQPIDSRCVGPSEIINRISEDIHTRCEFIVANQDVFSQSELLRDLMRYLLQIIDGPNDHVIHSDAVILMCAIVAKDAIATTPRLKNIADGMGDLSTVDLWNLTCIYSDFLDKDWNDALRMIQHAAR
jgi:hypothetical protein